MFPAWSYFPRNAIPPAWSRDFVRVVQGAQSLIDTEIARPSSDVVLAALAPGLGSLGYSVETSKRAEHKIRRPVLFGDQGAAAVAYELDAFHDELGIAVEVEAGRGAQNNADYRDLIRASLVLDANYCALVMPSVYRFSSGGKAQTTRAYASTRMQLDAIYASHRLQLPFLGLLLVGY